MSESQSGRPASYREQLKVIPPEGGNNRRVSDYHQVQMLTAAAVQSQPGTQQLHRQEGQW